MSLGFDNPPLEGQVERGEHRRVQRLDRTASEGDVSSSLSLVWHRVLLIGKGTCGMMDKWRLGQWHLPEDNYMFNDLYRKNQDILWRYPGEQNDQ